MAKGTIQHFDQLIGILNRGRFLDTCNEKLSDVLQALDTMPNEKGKGSITLTVSIVRQGGDIQIAPAVSAKLPETGKFPATPFWDKDGALSVEHPSQWDMFNGPKPVEEDERLEGKFSEEVD